MNNIIDKNINKKIYNVETTIHHSIDNFDYDKYCLAIHKSVIESVSTSIDDQIREDLKDER